MSEPLLTHKRISRLVYASLVVAMVSACSVHDSGYDQPIKSPGPFRDSGQAPIPDRWWTAFNDATLNRLQQQALSKNFNLRAARDRLRAARAVVDRASASLFPSLDLSIGARSNENGAETFDSSGEQYTGELAAQYEVDLWKRIESSIDAVEFEQAATREDLESAAIMLSADLASIWYELVQLRGQRRILLEQIETNKTVLNVVRKRFANGLVRASDVLRQQRLLESTREQLEAVKSQIELRKHQLLVLTGKPPMAEFQASRQKLPQLPAKPEAGLPSNLIRRRPDVQSAFYTIKAADRAVAVAIADRFPQLTLGVNGSVTSDDLSDLFDNWATTLAADVLAPLIDGGRRRAEVRRTRWVKAQRIDEYGQTVLTAFREVSDALSRESRQVEQIRLIRKQLKLAKRTFERLRREYLNGDISYIDVLDALTRQQQLQRDLVDARFQLINNRISLYRALAGGWEGIVPPSDDAAQVNDEEGDDD